MNRINSIKEFKNSTKVFIPENNLGNEASHMWNMIKSHSDTRLKAYYENGTKIGIHKGKSTADQYKITFEVKLFNNHIFFSDKFFTVSHKHTITNIKGIAKEQLERHQYSYEEPKDIYSNPKFKISGKVGGENDDLSIAIQQCVYHGFQAIQRPMYIK